MKRILIADDEPDILKIVNFRLIKKGYEVIITTDGEEALKTAKEQMPDLILLDVSMPKLRGDEVCLAVKGDEALKHIPVLLMTASTRAVAEENISAINADGFILKPFETEDFLTTIDKFLS